MGLKCARPRFCQEKSSASYLPLSLASVIWEGISFPQPPFFLLLGELKGPLYSVILDI